MKRLIKVALIVLALCHSVFASGPGNKELLKFYNKMGKHGASNITKGGAYRSQLGGGYDGGNLSYRSPIVDRRIGVDLTLPSLKGSCGGIDGQLGGMGFLNGNFDQMFDAIASNVAEIGASMLLDALLQSDVGQQIRDKLGMVQGATSMNINSCRLAQLATNTVADAVRSRMEQRCSRGSGDSGSFEASQKCGKSSSEELAKKDPYANYNVTWEAISRNKFLKGDDEQYSRQAILSMLGTVIIKDGKPTPYKPLSGAYKALLSGGQGDTYSCMSDGCLSMLKAAVVYPPEKSLAGKIGSHLRSIADKIIADEGLSESEIGLVETTRLPIYKLLVVYSAYTRGNVLDVPKEYSEAVAVDVLRNYSQAVIDESESILGDLTELSTEVVKEVKANARQSEAMLASVLREQQQISGTTAEIIDRSMILESKLYEFWAKQMRM